MYFGSRSGPKIYTAVIIRTDSFTFKVGVEVGKSDFKENSTNSDLDLDLGFVNNSSYLNAKSAMS